MRRFPVSALLAMVLLARGASVEAADVLRIATLNLPPYGFTVAGKPAGLTFDAGRLIAMRAGFQPVNEFVPLARGLAQLEQGEADLLILFPSEKAQAAGVSVGCVIPMENVIMGRAGLTLSSLADLHGKRVAKVRGAKYDEAFAADKDIVVYETDDYAQNLRMLQAGRVEAVVGPALGLHHAAGVLGLKRTDFGVPLVLGVKHACVFVSRKSHEAVREKVARAVEAIRAEGGFAELMEAYTLK